MELSWPHATSSPVSAIPTMTFFQDQIAARKRTKYLIASFFVSLAAVVVSIYALLWGIFSVGASRAGDSLPFFSLKLFAEVALGVSVIVLLGSLWKTLQLRSGGAVVARSLGGVLLDPNSRAPRERKVLNVVEEMSIASGIPVPAVYLLPEPGINAFAAGWTVDDAVIGVTEGAIEVLSRDELQGVIAHEFSHIFHGDMRLNLRLMGWIHGIVIISLLGYWILRSSARGARFSRGSRNSKSAGAAGLALGLGLYIIGLVGVFCGKLIKAAVSRQREFLADASAVQFTRNPTGLAGALKKIGGFSDGSHIHAAHAEESSHLFFANGLRQAFFGFLATHPPLDVRIRRLDPNFNGVFPAISLEGGVSTDVSQLAGSTHSPEAHPFSAKVGLPSTTSLAVANEFLSALPPVLLNACRDPFDAQTVIFSLLLNGEAEQGQTGLTLIAERHGEHAAQKTSQLLAELSARPRAEHLSILDLTLPALRRLSPQQRDEFLGTLHRISQLDGQTSLFEYLLHHTLQRHVLRGAQLDSSSELTVSLEQANSGLQTLLAVLATQGSNERSMQLQAFQAGTMPLRELKNAPFIPSENLSDLDRALSLIAATPMVFKKRVIEACVRTIEFDSVATVDEQEILRVICDVLDCPVPPLNLNV